MFVMIRRSFAQASFFPNMITHSNNGFTVPAVSHGVIGIGRRTYDPSWNFSVFGGKKLVTGTSSLCSGIRSSCRFQKVQFLHCSCFSKLQFLQSDSPGSISSSGFQNVRNVCHLWNLQNIQKWSHIPIRAASLLSDENCGLKKPRMEKKIVQKLLFEYLHCTRNFDFLDAEHISKNSPTFLQSLLDKVKDGEEVRRSVSRHMYFYPLNEFEPFFESIGLKPSEFYPFLPRNMFYLIDDVLLIKNYHVLCNYGVPRSKIGKMYKEGSEMFRYDYGTLNSNLQRYENLGLSKPTVIKLVTACPSLLIGELNKDFLEVLKKLKALGIDMNLIRGSFSDKSAYHWDRILEMLTFLVGMGHNQQDLETLISLYPRIIFDDSGKKIYILVALLLKLGIKMGDILQMFLKYPQILVGMFVKNLWKSIYFLIDIGMDLEDVKMTVKAYPHVLGASSSRSPRFVMQSLNLSKDRLRDIIKEDPSQFTYLASTKKSSMANLRKVDGTFMREKTEFLLKLGFVENSDEMIRALKKFRGRGDQLQERFDLFVGMGLDCHTVSVMIRSVPTLLNQSIDVLRKKIAYLIYDLGYPLEALTDFPTYLCYNIDKIKLRFSMFRWLKENGTMFHTRKSKMDSSTIALSTILACSDARFFKYFINLHPKGPDEWERLKGSCPSK